MILYHATYMALAEDIRIHGLCRGLIRQKAWGDCSSEYIYLCQDATCAVSFCETSTDVPEHWLDDIVVIAVNAEALDASLFELDKNITNSARLTSYQYKGDVPVSALLAFLRRTYEETDYNAV